MTTSGVLNIFKEEGPTSHDVVANVRRLLPPKSKVGHAGTLDPLAKGVLPICMGQATKLFPYLLDCQKTYRAVLLLGRVTDTQDVTGETLSEAEAGEISPAGIQSLLDGFRGHSLQLPPMHSAIRVGGMRLHELARAGIEVEREPREIEVYDIQVLEVDGPRVTFDVTCSRGTYIRTLCHDAGARQGAGGCMEALTRTVLGPFRAEEAHSLGAVETAIQEGRLEEILISPAAALAHIPAVSVRPGAEKSLRNGMALGLDDIVIEGALPGGEKVLLLSQAGDLIGVGRLNSQKIQTGRGKFISPERIFAR